MANGGVLKRNRMPSELLEKIAIKYHAVFEETFLPAVLVARSVMKEQA